MLKTKEIDFTESRYEKKFVIELPMSEILRIIRFHPACFREVFEERTVNNIYFDSVDMVNYREHRDGIAERAKVRLRWYGKTFARVKAVLEIKAKNNEYGKKINFKIDNKKLNLWEHEKLPDWVRERLRLFKPVLLNSYKRKYFVSADGRFRITLDKDLKFYRLGSMESHSSGLKILEVKYNRGDEGDVGFITEGLPFRLGAFSKYLFGVELLGA